MKTTGYKPILFQLLCLIVAGVQRASASIAEVPCKIKMVFINA